VNLRRFGERAPQALSSYAPEPFFVFNNLPGSIAAYKAIGSLPIATDRRDRIADAL
jgi:hypothetical protein